MLGRPYTVSGTVIEGKKLGRTIGFPTANLTTGEAQLPADGVWAVRAKLADGRDLWGVANLGLRPTVGGDARVFEVHLFDFMGDLYGEELDIRFHGYIRHELKFPSIEALRLQIQRDAAAARELLAVLES